MSNSDSSINHTVPHSCSDMADLMQLMSSPHETKREMDGGRKARYYAAILIRKNDLGLMEHTYSGAVCELLSHQRRK